MDNKISGIIEVQGDTLYVKEGVEEFHTSDFADSLEKVTGVGNVTKIIFPSTLREIPDSPTETFEDIEKANVGWRYIQEHLPALYSIDMSACVNFTEFNIQTFAAFPHFVELVVPPNLRKVGSYTFGQSHNLKKIDLGSNVEEIGTEAFHSCESLEEVILSPKVTKIGHAAFCQCKELKVVKQAYNVIEVDKGAFQCCEKLESIDLSERLQRINSMAFAYCYKLKNLDFLTNVEIISYGAFSDCDSLKEIEFGNRLKRIDTYAFSTCNNLEKVKFGPRVETISNEAFMNCKALREVTFNSMLKSVDRKAFSSVPSFKGVLPNNLTFKSYAQITNAMPKEAEYEFLGETWTKEDLDNLLDLKHNLNKHSQELIQTYFKIKFSDELILKKSDEDDFSFDDDDIMETSLF